MSTTNNARRMVILGALTLGLFGCGAAATTSSHPASPSPSPSVSTAAPAASTSGYAQQVADQALCTSYENLVQSGDTEGIASAVAGAGSTVTQSLATDMLRAASGTTLQQDDQNQVYVAMDCGIVSAGRQPIELRQ